MTHQKANTPEPRSITPHPGPQTQFFESKADIVIFGGAAGGGKSFALVAEPLRRIHRGGFRGGIFRRTNPQLKGQGGVWDECQELYRAFGAKMRQGQELDATFPSGANVAFLHLQHEKTKYDYQGHQFTYLGFDELTHFTQSQFFYMLSRNRSCCGIKPYVRATCNPDAGSWVADFIEWWIDPQTGLPIHDRSGHLRYFVRDDDTLQWADSAQELVDRFPDYSKEDVLSVTFIPASLDDNPSLQKRDPAYRARLKALSRIERDRLLHGNWRVAEGSQIEEAWIRRFDIADDHFEFVFQDHQYRLPIEQARRIATIDTAGTSKERAAMARGSRASWSVCGVWDIVPRWTSVVDNKQVHLSELCFLRYVWRAQIEWSRLKVEIDNTLASWNVQKAYIENAHFGQPLAKEIRSCATELIGPVLQGMGDRGEEAKLERAIASGMLARFEHGKIFVPREQSTWLDNYLHELLTWTGNPGEIADQIDMTSYAAFASKAAQARWGGMINSLHRSR